MPPYPATATATTTLHSRRGGVDLWRNSYTLPGVGVVGDRGGGRHPAQSMMDGKLEVRGYLYKRIPL